VEQVSITFSVPVELASKLDAEAWRRQQQAGSAVKITRSAVIRDLLAQSFSQLPAPTDKLNPGSTPSVRERSRKPYREEDAHVAR
jgi:hypothetical protein